MVEYVLKIEDKLFIKICSFSIGILSFINFSLYLFFNLSHKLNKALFESFDSICLNILSNSEIISLYSSFSSFFSSLLLLSFSFGFISLSLSFTSGVCKSSGDIGPSSFFVSFSSDFFSEDELVSFLLLFS